MRRIRRGDATSTRKDRRPVFLSFRSDDAEKVAVLLYRTLRKRKPDEYIFDYLFDPVDWVGALIEKVRGSGIVVVVIGMKWLDVLSERHKAGDSFSDPVHVELVAALRYRVPLVAVVAEGAALPTRESLPPNVSALADVPSVPVRSSSWLQDVDAVAAAVDRYRRA